MKHTGVGESTLLDGVVGELLEHFEGLILSARFVESLLGLFEAIVFGQPIGIRHENLVLELRLHFHQSKSLVPTAEGDV